MNQLDYAESWLWVHFLLESEGDHQKLIQDQLARLRMTGNAVPLSKQLAEIDPEIESRVIEHLQDLAERLATEDESGP